jgi:two-component system response regulator MprA
MRLLLVEDDELLGNGLQVGLQQSGYAVDWVKDGQSAELFLGADPYDLMILDIGLPKRSGIEVLRSLRKRGDPLPVLMLTARDTVEDKVAGLDSGADDYLVKPFAPEELLARIRALLRRTDTTEKGSALTYADLTLDPLTRETRRGPRSFNLTPKEFDLLAYLLRHPRQVIPRERILQDVWGYDFDGNGNVLEVYVGYLRTKTEAGGEPRLIHTVRGVGYALREET